MKKIIASAVGLMLGGTLLATSVQAFENQFGGYWRTRFMFEDNLRSYPGESKFHVDTRSRLYYTAKFNDNLKFVNKFEFNGTWGDDGYGDLGTDGMDQWRIKHSYVDATFNALNVRVGAQGYVINRGFTYDDDHIGLFVRGAFGAVEVTGIWARFEDEDFGGADFERDMLHAGALIRIGEDVNIVPSITAVIASDGTTEVEMEDGTTAMEASGDENYVYVGVDVNAKLDPVSLWGTFVYQTGDELGVDKDAFALGLGADAGFVRGKFYYATGDDGGDPTENTEFTAISAWHTTSEILGRGGVLSAGSGQSAGTFGFEVSNMLMAGVGTTIKPMDGMTLKLDGWYGALAEDNAQGNADLGIEFDAVLSVVLLEKLKADFVFAYLVAGDATNDATGNSDDCIEAGMRLSLSF